MNRVSRLTATIALLWCVALGVASHAAKNVGTMVAVVPCATGSLPKRQQRAAKRQWVQVFSSLFFSQLSLGLFAVASMAAAMRTYIA